MRDKTSQSSPKVWKLVPKHQWMYWAQQSLKTFHSSKSNQTLTSSELQASLVDVQRLHFWKSTCRFTLLLDKYEKLIAEFTAEANKSFLTTSLEFLRVCYVLRYIISASTRQTTPNLPFYGKRRKLSANWCLHREREIFQFKSVWRSQLIKNCCSAKFSEANYFTGIFGLCGRKKSWWQKLIKFREFEAFTLDFKAK